MNLFPMKNPVSASIVTLLLLLLSVKSAVFDFRVKRKQIIPNITILVLIPTKMS